MKILLTPEESEKIFYAALCNSIGQVLDYGFRLEYSGEEYQRAKAALTAADRIVCREDVWMELLRQGGTLRFVDLEFDGEYTTSIVLQDIHERVQKAPAARLIEVIEEKDDCDTGDAILQTVLFGELVFG